MRCSNADPTGSQTSGDHSRLYLHPGSLKNLPQHIHDDRAAQSLFAQERGRCDLLLSSCDLCFRFVPLRADVNVVPASQGYPSNTLLFDEVEESVVGADT